MQEVRIFDGDRLRASLFNPDQKRLFVSFRQRIANPGQFEDKGPVGTYVRAGYAHLHIQARMNDWFINGETEAFEDCLRDLTQTYDRVVSMGFSMGGYGALRFARALRLNSLIAISPQFSIAEDHVPFDRRFRKFAAEFDSELGALQTRQHDLTGVILVDPFRAADLLNAEMIQLVFTGLQLARLGFSGHPASAVLREGGQFGKFQKLLLKPTIRARDVITLHRRARRGSPRYWQQVANKAEQVGRERLLAQAREYLASLTGGKAS